MAPILTISVLTLSDREKFLAALLDTFEQQEDHRATIRVVLDDGQRQEDGGASIGEKRQMALDLCDTPYHCFFDDDDLPDDEYTPEIMKALDSDPDVVGFKLGQYHDGVLTGLTLHSLTARKWSSEMGPDGLMRHYRTPNHLNPVRTEMARAIGFKDLTAGEDADFSNRLFAKFGATMKEAFIDKYLYRYLYRTKQREPLMMYDEFGSLTKAGMLETIRLGGSVSIRGNVLTRAEQVHAHFK